MSENLLFRVNIIRPNSRQYDQNTVELTPLSPFLVSVPVGEVDTVLELDGVEHILISPEKLVDVFDSLTQPFSPKNFQQIQTITGGETEKTEEVNEDWFNKV